MMSLTFGLFTHVSNSAGPHGLLFKGRFLEFRMCHNFVNLFSKLSPGKNTFYKEISIFQ